MNVYLLAFIYFCISPSLWVRIYKILVINYEVYKKEKKQEQLWQIQQIRYNKPLIISNVFGNNRCASKLSRGNRCKGNSTIDADKYCLSCTCYDSSQNILI